MISWAMVSKECSPCCDSLTDEGDTIVRVSVFVASKTTVPYWQFTYIFQRPDKCCMST